LTRVAIAVPAYRPFTPEEEISLRHLETVMPSRPRFLFVPQSLDPARPGYGLIRFPDECFTSIGAYSLLLLNPDFYRQFLDFEFLLIYQPDCLVFSDRLSQFCAAGFDYIGAPWLADRKQPELGFSRVGNGGLSLRRVASCLGVLDASRSSPHVLRTFTRLLRRREPTGLVRKARVAREVGLGIDWYRRNYSLNEDHFWCDRAALFDPDFRVADIETGLAFAFDEAPRSAFAELGRLPMGCHDWVRNDRTFWQPHLLQQALERKTPGCLGD